MQPLYTTVLVLQSIIRRKNSNIYYDIGIAIIRFCIGIRAKNKKTTKDAAFILTKTDYKLGRHGAHPNSSLLY
jgi:hypothetical protein